MNRIKKLVILSLSLILAATVVQAQYTTEDSVKLAIGKWLSALHNSDGKSYGRCFTANPRVETVIYDKSGNPMIKQEVLLTIANVINQIPKGAAEEKISFDAVKVDGALAVVWAPYKFYYNGQMIYCGVNLLQLIRANGEWTIYYMVDTRHTNKCD